MLLLFCWCFTALQHYSSRARSVNLSTLFLGKSPRKGENGCKNYFVTNLHERMLPVRIEPATIPIPGGHASDKATMPNVSAMKHGSSYADENATVQ